MQAKLPQCDSVKTFLSLWVMRTHSHAHTGGMLKATMFRFCNTWVVSVFNRQTQPDQSLCWEATDGTCVCVRVCSVWAREQKTHYDATCHHKHTPVHPSAFITSSVFIKKSTSSPARCLTHSLQLNSSPYNTLSHSSTHAHVFCINTHLHSCHPITHNTRVHF